MWGNHDYTLHCRRLCANTRESELLADLGRFSQLLEETEHFCGCGQEEVAKIVQCGEPIFGFVSALMSAFMVAGHQSGSS